MSRIVTNIRGAGGTAISHSKELLGLAYVEAIAASSGVNFNEPKIDNDGIDITFRGKGFSGLYSEPKFEAQLKCTSKRGCIDTKSNQLVYQLDAKNYNYLIGPSQIPLILIVHHAPYKESDWLEESEQHMKLKYASYWFSLYGKEKIETNSRVIRIPLEQRFDSEAMKRMMHLASKGDDILNLNGGKNGS